MGTYVGEICFVKTDLTLNTVEGNCGMYGDQLPEEVGGEWLALCACVARL